MVKKGLLFSMLFLLLAAVCFGGPEDYEKKLKTIRIPSESDFKGQSLSDVLSQISKISNVSIVASSEVADTKIDLYLPANSTLEKIIETIKTTNGLVGEIKNDTLILKRGGGPTRPDILFGKVVGKVTEIDKITGIKGVTMSLGDDVNTLVMSDVGGAFIMDNVKPGTYILKAVAKGYLANSEIIEVKPKEDCKVQVTLQKINIKTGPDTNQKMQVITDKGDIRNTEIVEVTFADPAEIKEIIKPIVPLESIVTDAKSNVLILIGTEDNINTAKSLIKKLDVSTKQIKIKAKIYKVTNNKNNNLGMNWSVGSKDGDYDFKGKASFGGSLNLTFSDVVPDALNASLELLAAIGEAKVDAQPYVVTINGETATIDNSDEVVRGYIKSTSKDGASTDQPLFKRAGILLDVTPTIKSDKTILVNIHTKMSNFASSAYSIDGSAEKASEIKTKVRVKNGEPIRLGGLRRIDETTGVSKIPILGDIPLLGLPFRKQTSSFEDTDLFVELVPELVE